MPAPPPAMRFVAAEGLEFPFLDAIFGEKSCSCTETQFDKITEIHKSFQVSIMRIEQSSGLISISIGVMYSNRRGY
jgi:hypothetical protein